MDKKTYQAIISSIPQPVIVTDLAHRLLHANEAAIALLDIQPPWEGRAVAEIVQQPDVLALLRQPHPAASPQETELTFRQGQHKRYLRSWQKPLRDARGKIRGVITLLQDITAFKMLDNMKSDFMATVSHEFRTPLTSITMTIDILLQGLLGQLNDEQRDLLAGAKDDCDRLTRLLRDLLNLSKLESGSYSLDLVPTNLRELVESAARPLQLPMQEKSIHFERHLPPDMPELHVDQQHLSWVISNLLGNAIRHTPEHGMISLSASLQDGQVCVSVADNGSGIPPEALDTIFEKFVQLSSPDVHARGSVGLGLAICREVVKAHGGRIWVESELGQGSTFRFIIPLQPPVGAGQK